jgi:hypothetical protein
MAFAIHRYGLALRISKSNPGFPIKPFDSPVLPALGAPVFVLWIDLPNFPGQEIDDGESLRNSLPSIFFWHLEPGEFHPFEIYVPHESVGHIAGTTTRQQENAPRRVQRGVFLLVSF